MLEIADKVIDGIKTVRDIAKRLENAELLSRVADLVSAGADLKLETAELKAQIIGLMDENAALKRKADIRANMTVRDRVCYPITPIPGYGNGPFCPLCLEKEGVLIELGPGQFSGRICTNCEKYP